MVETIPEQIPTTLESNIDFIGDGISTKFTRIWNAISWLYSILLDKNWFQIDGGFHPGLVSTYLDEVFGVF